MRQFLYLLLLFVSGANLTAAGYFGVYNNQVHAVINGQTFLINGDPIHVNGGGPYILQTVYIKTEKWVRGGGMSNVCGGTMDYQAGGGISGSLGLSYNSGFPEQDVGNNVVQEWAAFNINRDLGSTNGDVYLSLDFHITGNDNAYSECPNTINYMISSALALQITKLSAELKQSAVLLSWMTESVHDIEYWRIWASRDGKFWEARASLTLGKTPERGFQSSWEFLDQAAAADGVLYFKIEQMNSDGTSDFSGTVSVPKTKQKELSLYPNPVNEGIVSIQVFGESNGPGTLMIYDANGQLLFKKTLEISRGQNVLQLDVTSFGKGSYVMVLNQGRYKTQTSHFNRL